MPNRKCGIKMGRGNKLTLSVNEKELKCPECGALYGNYADYFACWTSHLSPGKTPLPGVPREHDKAVHYYTRNPNAIEEGLRILGHEVSIFRGRIDLIAIDNHHNLCLIDVTSGLDWKRKVKQLRRYKRGIEWIGRHIFGVAIPGKTRLLVVKPGDYVKDVTHRSV